MKPKIFDVRCLGFKKDLKRPLVGMFMIFGVQKYMLVIY